MRNIPAILLAAAGAAALAGTAVAAAPKSPAPKAQSKTHVMSVPLPDGSAVRVEYAGDVAPKVSVSPRAMADAGAWGMPFPSFAGFDRMIAEMNRQSEQMIRQAQQAARQPSGAGGAIPYIAAYGNMPAGETSTTVVSVCSSTRCCCDRHPLTSCWLQAAQGDLERLRPVRPRSRSAGSPDHAHLRN